MSGEQQGPTQPAERNPDVNVKVTSTRAAFTERAADWLFTQGVSTVLLVVLVAMIAYWIKFLVPQHLSQIQDGYKSAQESFVREVERLAVTYDKDQERDATARERDYKMFMKIQEAENEIDRLKTEVHKAEDKK